MAKPDRELKRLLKCLPRLGKGVYIAQGAMVVGDVKIGEHSSVWYNAVLRGDINAIRVGHHTNIQDMAVLHLEDDRPCVLGNFVTVGHGAIVHACTVGDESLIGMGSVVLDGAVIGRHCLVGARALVTAGMKVPDGSLVLGMPARIARPLTRRQYAVFKSLALKYARNAAFCLKHKINVSSLCRCPSPPRG